MKLMLHLIVLTVLTVLVLTMAGLSVRAQTGSKATVVGITGKWTVVGDALRDCRPGHDHDRMSDLRFASCFVVDENSCVAGTGGSLAILIHGQSQAHSYPCDRDEDLPCKKLNIYQKTEFTCVRHIVTSLQTSQGSFGSAIVLMFAESVSRYIAPVSRGLEAEVADGVVPLQGDRVDLAPAFQKMDPGTYRLRLESLSSSSNANMPVQIQWSGNGPAYIPAARMQPGLYRVVRLTSNGVPAGLDAWVLVSSPDRFAEDSANFRSAVEATEKWPDDVDARAPRALLRAYLDSLSRQTHAGR
jgi:hypothetical protein